MAEAATSLKLQAPPAELEREPLVANRRSFGWISDQVSALVEGKTPRWWWIAFVPSFLALCMLGAMLTYQISTGVGVWGNNHPVMWGWDIINFTLPASLAGAGDVPVVVTFTRVGTITTTSRPADTVPKIRIN